MSLDYDKVLPFEPKNQAEELKIASKFQRRLIPSKLVYFYLFFLAIFALLQKYKIVQISDFDELMSWLGLLFAVLTAYSVISTLFLSICPYCHRFQHLFNGKSLSVDGESISSSQGIVPFIHYCNRCNAPLSSKAVMNFYNHNEMSKDKISKDKYKSKLNQ